MTKKLKVTLLIILGAICSSCVFAGCKVGRAGREEILKDYVSHITYYGNGGMFNHSASLAVRDVYFKSNPSPFYDIVQNDGLESTDGITVSYSGYDLLGWYEVDRYKADDEEVVKGLAAEGDVKYTYSYLDEDGNMTEPVPVFIQYYRDENGNIKTDRYGEPWAKTDLENDRPLFRAENSEVDLTELQVRVVATDKKYTPEMKIASGERMYVCAKWAPALKVEYRLAYDGTGTIKGEDGKEYKNGDKLGENNFSEGVSAEQPIGLTADVDGYEDQLQFVCNYLDKECLIPVTGALEEPADGKNAVVYSKYLESDWTVVDDAEGVKDMFAGLSRTANKFYIKGNIDCSSLKFEDNSYITLNSSDSARPTRATIDGRNRVLSNLNFSIGKTQAGIESYSVFGNLTASADIRNLTLKNVEVRIASTGRVGVYGVFGACDEGATFKGVKIDGINVKVTLSSTASLSNGENNWLFGGASSDDEYLAANADKITVVNKGTLTKN